jgi:hypothetical protein
MVRGGQLALALFTSDSGSSPASADGALAPRSIDSFQARRPESFDVMAPPQRGKGGSPAMLIGISIESGSLFAASSTAAIAKACERRAVLDPLR